MKGGIGMDFTKIDELDNQIRCIHLLNDAECKRLNEEFIKRYMGEKTHGFNREDDSPFYTICL